MAEISEDRLRQIVREELAPTPPLKAIPLLKDDYDAVTRPGQAAEFNISWAHGNRTAYVEGDEQAVARHDQGLRAAMSEMAFPASVGGSVATLLLDEMARVQALPDEPARELWERSQPHILARLVGPANVAAAETAAKELAAKIKDKGYRAELEGTGALKSAVWAAQAWLQAQRIALRNAR